MTRKEEIYRKCSTLLHAFAGCQTDFSTVLLSKYFELRRQLKSLSPEMAAESVENHRQHVCEIAGIKIYRHGNLLIPIDTKTNNPITWGNLIERMNP